MTGLPLPADDATSFDLYGHGVQNNIPSVNPTHYSNGHDRRRGPPRCRGIDPSCGNTPHDHACCCDPCRHAHLTTICDNLGGCCRCVPYAICAVFTPDLIWESADCTSRTWYARAVQSTSAPYGASYTFPVPGGDNIVIFVGDDDDGSCIWRITYGVLSQEVPLLHSGAVHCQAPPAFTVTDLNIPVVNGLTTEDCIGDVTFSPAATQMIPFLAKYPTTAETAAVSCGDCTEVCNILCVRRGNIAEETYTRVDFAFDSIDKWVASDNSDEFFTLIEDGGVCYLLLDGITGVFVDSQIELTPCAIGLSLYVEDAETGDWIKISCNKCSCWDYICGTCRCVCKDLCIVGSDGVDLISKSIGWDVDSLSWTDGVDTAGLQKADDGGCEMTYTGFADPVVIDDACGDDLAAVFSRSLEDAEIAGAVKYRYAYCRNCASCNAGTCLAECQNPPPVIWCDLEASAWEPMLGCDDGDPCFDPVTFPMPLVFVPTIAAPAGEWRWIGSVVIECHDCDTGGVDDTPRNFVVQADLGCDGILTLRVERHDSAPPLSESVSMTIPCDDLAWEETFNIDGAGAPLGCCNVATFLGTLYL